MATRRTVLKAAAALALPFTDSPVGRRRLREYGLRLGLLSPGPLNAITDVAGLTVGQVTVIDTAKKARTGVTAILPRGTFGSAPCTAGAAVLNGNGEMTGVMAIRRTGLIDVPILLTGTANIGIAYDAALSAIFTTRGSDIPPNPVVAECWDALGDIRGRHLTAEHVLQAMKSAASGPVAEGGVGGGAGMTSYGFKGGIGTSSRVVSKDHGGYTVGVLVNANHGTREQLTIAGVPVGQELRGYPAERSRSASSIVMVAATDAPLSARQLERLALRMALGLARTGATANTSSGDLMLALSTAKYGTVPLDDDRLTPLYQAVVEATEESVLNALALGTDVVGADGTTCPGLPLDRVVAILKSRGAIQ